MRPSEQRASRVSTSVIGARDHLAQTLTTNRRMIRRVHDHQTDCSSLTCPGTLRRMHADRIPSGRHRALRRGRVSIVGQIYLATAATDRREQIFLDVSAAAAASRCFASAPLAADATVLAWVLMPDHAHWLIQLGDCKPLSTVISGLKSATGREANKALGRQRQVWARSFHDHALRGEEDVRDAARYIVANPIRAGLVSRAGDYPFWDAVRLPTAKSCSP